MNNAIQIANLHGQLADRMFRHLEDHRTVTVTYCLLDPSGEVVQELGTLEDIPLGIMCERTRELEEEFAREIAQGYEIVEEF